MRCDRSSSATGVVLPRSVPCCLPGCPEGRRPGGPREHERHVVNRTLFRGVTAGLMSGVLLGAGAIATGAIADSPSRPVAAAPTVAQDVRLERPAHTPIRPPIPN